MAYTYFPHTFFSPLLIYVQEFLITLYIYLFIYLVTETAFLVRNTLNTL